MMSLGVIWCGFDAMTSTGGENSRSPGSNLTIGTCTFFSGAANNRTRRYQSNANDLFSLGAAFWELKLQIPTFYNG